MKTPENSINERNESDEFYALKEQVCEMKFLREKKRKKLFAKKGNL